MLVKQFHITSHLWVVRFRSTIRFSRTSRSVATRTQWSRPMKPRTVFEFLLSRRTETDRNRVFSLDQKADGMKSTPVCMPHYSGGDNATKVRRRNTCRNSFRDIFLHDPSSQARLEIASANEKQTKKREMKPVCFQNFLQLFSRALECPTTDNQGIRFLCDVLQTFKNSPVF